MNNKTILAVWHSSSKGKTSTLRSAANHLLSAYPNFQPIPGAPSVIPTSGDFRVVVQINGKIVAIESKGDPHTQLFERLEDLAKKFKADIILCTTRTRGDTITAVETIERDHGYEAIWTSTYQVSSVRQSAANDLKGQHIINLLQSLQIL